MRAVELAAVGDHGWQVPKVYWTGVPESVMRAVLEQLAGSADNPFERWSPDRLPSMVMPDDLVTTVIDGGDYLHRKTDALRAHATQVAVDGPFFALSNSIGQPLVGREYYRLVHGAPAGKRDVDGRETDLFAGIA
jgi:N-acetyl-1-D-myo-inositol-2-amino-2-deoxy-alpha-D-glucopyranoside deacetylase